MNSHITSPASQEPDRAIQQLRIPYNNFATIGTRILVRLAQRLDGGQPTTVQDQTKEAVLLGMADGSVAILDADHMRRRSHWHGRRIS